MTMHQLPICRKIAAAVLLCWAMTVGLALPGEAQSLDLPPVTRDVVTEGQAVSLIIRPTLSLNNNRLRLTASVSLDDLRAKAGLILAHLAERKSRCETRFRISDVSVPPVSGQRFRVLGNLHAEVWVCGFIKTFIASDGGSFAVALIPRVSDEAVSFRAELESLDLGQSLIALLGLEVELRANLETALNNALSGGSANLSFPPEVADLHPAFTGVELRGSEKTVELVVSAEASADPATLLKLLQELKP